MFSDADAIYYKYDVTLLSHNVFTNEVNFCLVQNYCCVCVCGF